MENDKVLLFCPKTFPSSLSKIKKSFSSSKQSSSIWTAHKRESVCVVQTQIIPSPEKRKPFILLGNKKPHPPNSPRKLVYKSNPLLFSLLYSFISLSLSQTPQLHSFIWPLFPLFLHFLFIYLQNFQYPLHQNVQPTSQIPEPINPHPS